ncbi:MAG: hypothetical protein HKO62_05615, partial [Gammaproteobacteria bacterium]|nr:hypothetical protein [Gammaproteobacteria bacterium]
MPDPEPSCHRLAARGVAVLLAVGATTLLLDRGELGPATLAHSVGVSSIGLGLLLSLLADRGRGRLRLDVVELVMLVALAWLFVALTWHPAPFVGLHQTLTWLTLPMAY